MFNDCKQPATVVSVVQQRSRWSKGLHLARWLIHTPWPILALDMLRANLLQLLVEGTVRPHEPAVDPSPEAYVTWDYCRGYADAMMHAKDDD